MDLNKLLEHLDVKENILKNNYLYIDVFQNPSNFPIDQVHLERSWNVLKKTVPKDLDVEEISSKHLEDNYIEKKTEIYPALDKRWLPKCVFYTFEPYNLALSKAENICFIKQNTQFLDSLRFMLSTNFHQFWCLILFEPTAIISLRSFLLNPIPSFETQYLVDEYAELYRDIFNNFLLIYERLITFKESEMEYMTVDYGVRTLIEKKLLNLPILITLALLYTDSKLDFVNRITSLYFNDASQVEFQIKEVEEMVKQILIMLEMLGGYVCGFDENAVVVPISVEKRPLEFSLSWVYSAASYLLNTVATADVLFQFHTPAIQIALNNNFPYRLPYMYVNIYKELYDLLDDREELEQQKDLADKTFDLINRGRTKFVDLFHTFTSFCLDETLRNIGNTKQQECIVETYLKLLTTALEDECFMCDYDMVYSVANQNEMFESCCPLDPTRTEFIVSCIKKFPRNKKLDKLARIDRQTIERIFKDLKPPMTIEEEEEVVVYEPEPGPSNDTNSETNIEDKIQDILDMFPHLGDGFVLKCLESYNYNTNDVINAILEENLPPHLYEVPFDSIRIPPEPEPEKPILAYVGKKPEYDDALKLLDDKKDLKVIKQYVLEGVQYNNDYLYDDEYDDRFDDDVPIKVADNPLDEDIPLANPNYEDFTGDPSSSSDEDDEQSQGVSTELNNRRVVDKSKIPFCEDPAKIRERREAQFRARHPQKTKDVVGNAKGQGQSKDVLVNRQRKSANKSSRANHNRKGGAQFKRTRGMIPS